MPIDGQPRDNGAVKGDPVLAREAHRLSLVGAGHRDMAHWLIEYEMDKSVAADQDELPAVVERICRKFFSRLARVTSPAACQALLSRALHIPRAEFAFLAGVRAGSNAEPLIEGLRMSVASADPLFARAGLEAVLGTLIDLLVSFIGEDLTLGMLREVWPDLPVVRKKSAGAPLHRGGRATAQDAAL